MPKRLGHRRWHRCGVSSCQTQSRTIWPMLRSTERRHWPACGAAGHASQNRGANGCRDVHQGDVDSQVSGERVERCGGRQLMGADAEHQHSACADKRWQLRLDLARRSRCTCWHRLPGELACPHRSIGSQTCSSWFRPAGTWSLRRALLYWFLARAQSCARQIPRSGARWRSQLQPASYSARSHR